MEEKKESTDIILDIMENGENVLKGDNDIIGDISNNLTENDIKHDFKTELAVVKGVRNNIQQKINKLESSSKKLNIINWTLFYISVICMGLTAIGINVILFDNITLVQLLGTIAITTKGLEKTLSIEKIIRKKENISYEMRRLLRKISITELQFYSSNILDKEIVDKLMEDTRKIWKHYDFLESQTLIQPSDIVDIPNESDKKDLDTSECRD